MGTDTGPASAPRSGAARARGPWPAVAIAALLLGGVAVEGQARQAEVSAAPGHARIAVLADSSIPLSVGDWTGTRSVPAAAAVALLRPNKIVSIDYRCTSTRETASLLFVHCSDARDLNGHFPPVCYPGQGYEKSAAQARDWTVGDLRITGMRYRFQTRGTGASEIVVDNFMIVPAAGVVRDMDAVNRAAGDNRIRQEGAAEVQIVTDWTMNDERRDEVVRTLIAPLTPLLHLILEGIPRETDR